MQSRSRLLLKYCKFIADSRKCYNKLLFYLTLMVDDIYQLANDIKYYLCGWRTKLISDRSISFWNNVFCLLKSVYKICFTFIVVIKGMRSKKLSWSPKYFWQNKSFIFHFLLRTGTIGSRCHCFNNRMLWDIIVIVVITNCLG